MNIENNECSNENMVSVQVIKFNTNSNKSHNHFYLNEKSFNSPESQNSSNLQIESVRNSCNAKDSENYTKSII